MTIASAALAQAEDPLFWKQAGQVTKDAAGRVTFAEIRDPSTYTVRIFSNGVWTTQYYRPHTTQALKVEAPDTVEEWLYDRNGNYAGMRVRIDGVALVVHSEGLGRAVSAADASPVSIEKDRGGRINRIHDAKGTDLIRFHFDEKGYLRSVDAGSGTLELSAPVNGNVRETLKADGRIVKSVTVAGSVANPHSLPFCLDVARQQLGVPENWRDRIEFRHSSTKRVTTVTDASGKPLLYLVLHGGDRFGFDTAGRPLFVDVGVNLAFETVEHESDTAAAMQEQSAVAPNRVVITSDGRIGICTEGAATGAIASFWTERMPNGATVTRYRTYGSAAPAKTNRATPQSLQVPRKTVPRLPAPDLYYYVCDATTVCTIGPDWCGCDSCTTTYYYCAGDTGGGGTSGDGGTSTSGGGTSASNQIQGDATLATQVNNAVNTAASKLATCGSSLTSLAALNGQTLGTMLAGKAGSPWSMATFIQGGANGTGQVFKMDTTSNPNGICAAGNPAYTSLYQNTTYICEEQFKKLSAPDQYVRLIHEELHALGYPENPPTAWAQTAEQISAMVAQRCP